MIYMPILASRICSPALRLRQPQTAGFTNCWVLTLPPHDLKPNDHVTTGKYSTLPLSSRRHMFDNPQSSPTHPYHLKRHFPAQPWPKPPRSPHSHARLAPEILGRHTIRHTTLHNMRNAAVPDIKI